MRDRPALAREFATKVRVSAEGVDAAELNDILAAACVARNGWSDPAVVKGVRARNTTSPSAPPRVPLPAARRREASFRRSALLLR